MAVAGHPEKRPELRQQLTANIGETEAGDLFSCSIQEQNFAFEVCGEQTAAHGINNILVECLQILQLATFLLEFGALAAQSLREAAGKIGYREERSQISEHPGLQFI